MKDFFFRKKYDLSTKKSVYEIYDVLDSLPQKKTIILPPSFGKTISK